MAEILHFEILRKHGQTNTQMKSAQRAGTLRNGVAVTDADVVTGYASQRLLWIGIVTDTECKPLTFGLFDNVACLNDSDADMDTDTCTDSLPQYI